MTEEAIFKERPKPYHPDIERAINLIGMKNDTRPVGSYRWVAFKYPSDVDILEEVVEIAPDLPTACHIYASRIRSMAIRVYLSQPRCYLADFKAGCDERLKPVWFIVKKRAVRYGRPNRGLSKETIDLVTPTLESAVRSKAITTTEMKKWLDMSPPDLYEAVREKYIIRWNIFELIKHPPRKTLAGDKVLKLEEALAAEQKPAKMDIWAPVKEGFTEVENVLDLRFKTASQEPTKQVTRLFWKSYASTMCHEIRKFLRTGKSLKAVKRVWFASRCVLTSKERSYPKTVLSRARQYIETISSSPLLTGGIAQLAMASSMIKVVIRMGIGNHRIPAAEFPMGRVLTQVLEATAYIRDVPAVGYSNKDDMLHALDEMTARVFTPFEEHAQKHQRGTTKEILRALNIEDFILSMCRSLKQVVEHVDHYVESLSRDWREKNLIDLKDFIRDIENSEKVTTRTKRPSRTERPSHEEEEEEYDEDDDDDDEHEHEHHALHQQNEFL